MGKLSDRKTRDFCDGLSPVSPGDSESLPVAVLTGRLVALRTANIQQVNDITVTVTVAWPPLNSDSDFEPNGASFLQVVGRAVQNSTSRAGPTFETISV